MLVGIMEINIYIYQARSLKEKRQLIKSLIQRLGQKFNISIAEVGDLDMWNKAQLGLSLVSNSSRLIDASFNKILDYIDQEASLEIVNHSREII